MNIEQKPITWSDAMITGIASIDEQHQILLNMLTIASEQLADNHSRLDVEEIVHDLMSYALYHFDTEEELMLKCDYPFSEREKHFQEHRSFSARVAELQQNLKQGKLVSHDELIGFLNEWLTNHLLNTDKEFGQFLCNQNNSNT